MPRNHAANSRLPRSIIRMFLRNNLLAYRLWRWYALHYTGSSFLLRPLLHKAQTPLIRFVVDLLWICCTTLRLVLDFLLGQGNNWHDLNKLIICGKMSDTDDDYVLFALMSVASATTFITLVTDADATKRKHRPRRKHAVWVILKYLRRCECYGTYNSSMRDLLSLDV